MANPLIGEVAMWTALKAYVVAASEAAAGQGEIPAGIAAAFVYRKLQNAPEVRGTPASMRLWSTTGANALSASMCKKRELLAERWRLHVVEAQAGGIYGGSILDVPYSYTGQLGDDIDAIRAGLIADLPPSVIGATDGVSDIIVTAQTPGQPLALTAGPVDLLTAVRTRQTARELAWCAGEITVEFEVVVELPRDDPDSVPSAMTYLQAIVGKLAHGFGPAAALADAGLAFMRYAMRPEPLDGLDRAQVRGRARADIVFTLDVGSRLEFDRVAAVASPTITTEV